MNSQHEAFIKWANSHDENWRDLTTLEIAFESWKAAQADKREFACKAVIEATRCVRNGLPYSLDDILNKVEQEQ